MRLTDDQLTIIRTYFAARPVKRAWLFGSYARGEADEQSDVDLLVAPDYSKRLGWEFYLWPTDLGALLGVSVDVVTEDGLSKYIKPLIDKDKELIYEN